MVILLVAFIHILCHLLCWGCVSVVAVFVILISGFGYLKPLLKRECEMRHRDRVILLAKLLLIY